MSISIIVAMSSNNVIGRGNDLPWRLPTDLKRFKTLTSGKTVVMGRKCWDSIPEKFRPLPNRTNVVITRNKDFVAEGCEVRHDLSEALKEFNVEGEELFVIGGSEIYKESFPLADKFYQTYIVEAVEGDITLQGFDLSKWEMVSFEGHFKEDNLTYRFVDYVSKEVFNELWQKEE